MAITLRPHRHHATIITAEDGVRDGSSSSSSSSSAVTAVHHQTRLHVLLTSNTDSNSSSLLTSSSSSSLSSSSPPLTPTSAADDREKDDRILRPRASSSSSSVKRSTDGSGTTSPLTSSRGQEEDEVVVVVPAAAADSSLAASEPMVRDEGWFRCDGSGKSECQMTLGSSFIDPLLANGQSHESTDFSLSLYQTLLSISVPLLTLFLLPTSDSIRGCEREIHVLPILRASRQEFHSHSRTIHTSIRSSICSRTQANV